MAQFLEILKVILLGIVEGVTEWLPISSTGHMILINELIHLDVRQEFMEVFLVVIQLGAILAVIFLFWSKIWPFCNHTLTPEEKKEIKSARGLKRHFLNFVLRHCDVDKWVLWFKIFVACIPTICVALPFNDFIEEKFNNYVVVAVALIVYGIAFIVIETVNRGKRPRIRRLERMNFWTALAIGFFQVLSVVPGTSRSGSTIIGGMICGCSRSVASEFTFFLAIPVMFGASLLKLVKFGFDFSGWEAFLLILGMVIAFFVSIFAIKFLLNYIRRHDFKAFGWYRIILGAVVLAFFLIRGAIA